MQSSLQRAMIQAGLCRSDGRQPQEVVHIKAEAKLSLSFPLRKIEVSDRFQIMTQASRTGAVAEAPRPRNASQVRVDADSFSRVLSVMSMNILYYPGVGYKLYANLERRKSDDIYADAWMATEYGDLLRKFISGTWLKAGIAVGPEFPKQRISFREAWTKGEPDTIIVFE